MASPVGSGPPGGLRGRPRGRPRSSWAFGASLRPPAASGSERSAAPPGFAFFRRAADLVQFAIVVALTVVAAVVLVRTVVTFLAEPGRFPRSLVAALDGILVVIILLDILRTLLVHVDGDVFPVRPFLVVGVLAGVRDILSASANLTLEGGLSAEAFHQAVTQLLVGVAVVLLLLVAVVLARVGRADEEHPRPVRRRVDSPEPTGSAPDQEGSAR